MGCTNDCPHCGSFNIKSEENCIKYYYPFLDDHCDFLEIKDKCKDCGLTGDFNGQNEIRIEEAKQNIQQKYMQKYLKNLKSKGFSNSYLERSLGIKHGTVLNWQQDKFSESEFILVRIIHEWQWIIDFSRKGFKLDSNKLPDQGQKNWEKK